MIIYLSGNILFRQHNALCIFTSGVGYQVFMTTNLLESFQDNQEISLYIYTAVRESEMTLYGFETVEQKGLFELLISVSGIGPKIALGIMNTPHNKLGDAIMLGDIKYLSSLPGIGNKTASRISLELKDKIAELNLGTSSPSQTKETTVYGDIIEALEHMGYPKASIVSALQNIPKELKKEQEIIRYVMQNVQKR